MSNTHTNSRQTARDDQSLVAGMPVLTHSHSMMGRFSKPESTALVSAVSCAARGYMGQTTSVQEVRDPPPCVRVCDTRVKIRVEGVRWKEHQPLQTK